MVQFDRIALRGPLQKSPCLTAVDVNRVPQFSGVHYQPGLAAGVGAMPIVVILCPLARKIHSNNCG